MGKEAIGFEVAPMVSGDIKATAGITDEETTTGKESCGSEVATFGDGFVNTTVDLADDGNSSRKELDGYEMPTSYCSGVNVNDNVGEMINAGKGSNGPDMSATVVSLQEIDSDGATIFTAPGNFPEKYQEKKAGTLVAATIKKYAVPRSSNYHGVTKLKWSGKFEAHLWDNTSRVKAYDTFGKFEMEYLIPMESDTEEAAAEAYDIAAIQLRGVNAVTKFDLSNYCEGGIKRLE